MPIDGCFHGQSSVAAQLYLGLWKSHCRKIHWLSGAISLVYSRSGEALYESNGVTAIGIGLVLFSLSLSLSLTLFLLTELILVTSVHIKMAATNACYKNISYWTEDSSDGNIRCGREIWKKKKKRGQRQSWKMRDEEKSGRSRRCQWSEQLGKTAWSKAREDDDGKWEGPLARTERSSEKSRRSCRCNKKQMWFPIHEGKCVCVTHWRQIYR